MKVKAKFKVESVKKYTFGEEVELIAIYEGATQNTSEDKHFSEATPDGNIKIFISNAAIFGHFVPGKVHYITFEEVL